MEYLLLILPKMLEFAILIGLGYACAWRGILKAEGMPTISGFLLKLVLPCLIVSLMHERGTTFSILYGYRRFILCQFLAYILLALAGLGSARLLRLKEKTFHVHSAVMMCGNYAFIVIPLTMAIFVQDSGQDLIPIGSVIDTILVWTLGITIFTFGSRSAQGSGNREGFWSRLAGKLVNPIIMSVIGMLLLNSLHIPLPAPILEVCDDIGQISSSLGLLYIGCHIYFMPKSDFSTIRRAMVVVLIKLFLVPLLVYFLSSQFLPQTQAMFLMLVTAAPSMTTSCMIANQYGLDEDYAAATVFVTTLSCMVTVPLLFMIISLL